MRFFAQVFWLQLKKLIRNKSLMVILCLLPLLCRGMVQSVSGQEEGRITAGICLKTSSPLGEELVNRLTDAEGNLVKFVVLNTWEELEQQVLQGKLECGFYLKYPLEQAVEKGSYRKIFTCWQTEDTAVAALLQELVAAQVMQVCGGEQAAAYMEKSPVFGQVDSQKAGRQYQEYLSAEGMMDLEVEILGQEHQDDDFSAAAAKQVVRGILAIFLLAASLLASVSAFSQQTLSRLAPMQSRTVVITASAAGLGVLSLGFAFLTLLICPLPGVDLWQEGVSLLAYQFALCGLGSLLGRLGLREETLLALLPFVLAGCLVLCPIVVDVTSYLPFLRPFNGLLLPTLYLRGEQGSNLAIFTMVFYGFLLFLLSLTKWKKERRRV